jgi:enoyl-CoA hydratase
MSGGDVLCERRDDVAIVTLNRPEKLNSLNDALRTAMMHQLDALAGDEAVRVVVVCGAGDRAFVAGADLAEFAARSPDAQRSVYAGRRLHDAVASFPKPILAAIHGYCFGGGCELALACDVRVADQSARFGQVEIQVGLVPGAGGTQRLARLVGIGQAMRLALSGDVIDAEEAHRIGLVDILVPRGEHVQQALALADRIAKRSPLALSLVKQSIRLAQEVPLSAGLAHEKELFLAAFSSEPAREGIAAFLARRRDA